MKQILTLTLLVITRISFASFYSGGSGTVTDPYQIANKSDLQYLSEHPAHWGYYFIQTDNISFTAADFAVGGDFYNGGEGFIPIGLNLSTSFTGSYIGDEHTIDSLYINRPSQDYVGLFGYVYGSASEINALFVTNATVIGKDNTGILIGELSSGTVINSFTSGSVTGNNTIGGVCGFMITNASMERCESNAAISGVYELGGLVGRTGSSSIIYSNSQGTITGTGLIGGLVGRAEYTPISECYSTSNVSGDEYIGGLIGVFDSETLLHCYSVGTVTGNLDVGGLIGLNFGTVQQSFWDAESSGQTTSPGGTAKTLLEMRTKDTFTDGGWDFTGESVNGAADTWKMGECRNNGYPVFSWQASEVYPDLTFGSIGGNVLDSATICYDESANIHALSWYNVTWHDSITAGNSVSSNSPFTTPNLTETTIFYAQADNGTCVNPFRRAFTVVVRPENVTNQTFEFCGSGSVTVGNNTYTASGDYTDVFTGANSCDSTVITHLTIQEELNYATTLDGLTITATQSGATYQWINCATQNPIDGETAQSFTATENGQYAVIVSNGPCSDTSACVVINTVGLTENKFASALSVYPNPGNGIFHIQFNQVPNAAQTLRVCNVFGEEIFRMEVKGNGTVDLSNYSDGVYFFSLENDNQEPAVSRVMKQ
jgi:hypothetical protein